MAAKKVNYIEMELLWLEGKAEELKSYCDSNPITSLTERVMFKETRGGGTIPIVVETIGQQIKTLRDTLQDYIKIIEAIEKLRDKESTKRLITRGDQELSPLESGEI
jgi:hypothetical protein